jgi:hypothetical protein
MSTNAKIDLAVEQYIKRLLPFNLIANANYSWLRDETQNSASQVVPTF